MGTEMSAPYALTIRQFRLRVESPEVDEELRSAPVRIASDPGVFGPNRIEIRHVWHQRIFGDTAEASGVEVVHGLLDLGAGVHHEWPVVLDGLTDRPPSEDEELELAVPRDPGVVSPDGDPVPGSDRPPPPTRPDPARR